MSGNTTHIPSYNAIFISYFPNINKSMVATWYLYSCSASPAIINDLINVVLILLFMPTLVKYWQLQVSMGENMGAK